MNINEFATRIASTVDLELFQNHCGMIYFDGLSSQSIAQKLGTKLKKQSVSFQYIHAQSLTKSQRMLDNLGLSTDLKIVYGFEELTCFFEHCLDAVLNPNEIQVPKDFDLLSDSEFLTKYKIKKNSVLEFSEHFNQFINHNFDKSLTANYSFDTMFSLNQRQYNESIISFNPIEIHNRPSQQDLASIYGLCASGFIQGLNFKPFSKMIVIIPQQLAKINYEFMPYKGLFENCKDGYGVMGLDSNWELLKTFGSNSSYKETIDMVISKYLACLEAMNSLQDDLSINF
jgi:hypothetical protein